MHLSIGKLAVILIAMLIVVTAVTTGIGLSTLQNDYRTLQTHQEAEAHDTVRNAALAIRNQIQFYQGILQRIATQPDVANLIEFGEVEEMSQWSKNLRRLLPGTLGAALVSPHGQLHGDPVSQRVGPACIADMQQLHDGAFIDFPPLHTDVPGLEHFDLLTQISTPADEKSGTVFVSFRLSIIDELLRSTVTNNDRIELLDGSSTVKLAVGSNQIPDGAKSYRMKIPETSWTLVLHRQVSVSSDSLGQLIIADSLILALSGLLIVLLVRTALSGFKRDMARVHAALSDVLEGHYHPSDEPTAVKETGILLPDIERLALRLQDQRDELRHQSLSDPLTGVFNRRYFDMMLAHLHEQSRRQQPAFLVIVDLNDFKKVNDEFGHQTGDRVLQNTARFLRARVRATDIVARLGGDEFALILTNTSHGVLDDWVASLLDDYDQRELGQESGRGIYCRLSVGLASIDAERYATAREVFDAADRIMYRVKQEGKGQHSRFAIADAPRLSVVMTSTSPVETR